MSDRLLLGAQALLGMRDTMYGIFILDVSQMVTMAEGASARTREHAYNNLISHWSAQVTGKTLDSFHS